MTAISSDFSETVFFPEVFEGEVEKAKREEFSSALVTQIALKALTFIAAIWLVLELKWACFFR